MFYFYIYNVKNKQERKRLEKIKTYLSKPNKSFSKKIFSLVENTKVLDLNSEYLYLLQTTHFKDTCCVAIVSDEIVGFVSAYKLPNKTNTLFVWQVAVDERFRGQNLAKMMMISILKRDENSDTNYINTTVSPSNKSSVRAFEKLAVDLKTKMVSKNFFEKEDFIDQHEEEVLYEIGPFKLKEK